MHLNRVEKLFLFESMIILEYFLESALKSCLKPAFIVCSNFKTDLSPFYNTLYVGVISHKQGELTKHSRM